MSGGVLDDHDVTKIAAAQMIVERDTRIAALEAEVAELKAMIRELCDDMDNPVSLPGLPGEDGT